MGIFKTFPVLVLLAAWANAHAASPEEFLRANGAPPALASALLKGDAPVSRCLTSGDQLFCARGRNYPGIAANARSRQAVLQNLALQVRNDLFVALASVIRARNLRDEQAVGEAFARGCGGRIKTAGLQFTSFSRGDWCGAIASAPLPEMKKTLPPIYRQKSFVHSYCEALLPRARALLARGETERALAALKELHDLNFADIGAYLLAARAFMGAGQPEEAQKIALELLADFAAGMNAAQAEDLGDIFLGLGMDTEAGAAYRIASARLAGAD